MTKRRAQGEGSVYEDPSRGRWIGQVWIDGRRRKVSAKTKAEAAAKIGRLLHGAEAERHSDRRATVRTVVEDWQAKALATRQIAPSTREVHQWASRLWIDELGTVKLGHLDAPTVEGALARLANRGLSRASLIKARSTLRQALQWAERRRLISHNPASAAELPNGANVASARRALDRDELSRLLIALEAHPLRPMFLLMARAGLRPGEAAAVCSDALELNGDPPTVAVVRAIQLRSGRPVLVDELKTTGARRTIALPPDVAEALREVKADDGLLFRSGDGGPLWPSTVRQELAKASTAADLQVVRPNELRHTAATLLANAGLPPHHVADILGHRSTRMVDAVYRHRPAVIRGPENVLL